MNVYINIYFDLLYNLICIFIFWMFNKIRFNLGNLKFDVYKCIAVYF